MQKLKKNRFIFVVSLVIKYIITNILAKLYLFSKPIKYGTPSSRNYY